MATAVKFPPSQRDFEVYHFLKEGGSTRSAAVRFGVSQTRVRQLARRVVTWAAEVLPADTEAETAGLLRVAVSVAGDRLDYFYQQTMEQWHATHQVKFLGLAIRITQAAARLPSRSCEIDAAAADLLEPEEESVGWDQRGQAHPEASADGGPAPHPDEDCSAENANEEDATKEPVVTRDATPRVASKLDVLLKDEKQASADARTALRTLLTAPGERAAGSRPLGPEDLGLSVEDVLRRGGRHRRRAK